MSRIELSQVLSLGVVVFGLAAGLPVAGAAGEGPQVLAGTNHDAVLVPGQWTLTDPMTLSRTRHTATLLPSGLVLVAGGTNLTTVWVSSELYSLGSGTWSSTGSMQARRTNHTATLLPSGLVLVAGGFDGTIARTACETYNEATGAWSSTGPLIAARHSHTATLLPSGLVLVTGGTNGTSARSSGELFNPASGVWTATGSMVEGRYDHTATLLPSGKVLVAGGRDTTGVLVSSELYDVGLGAWAGTGNLATGRYFHRDAILGSGQVLATGGFNGTADVNVVEAYDEGSGTWTVVSPLVTDASGHTLTTLASAIILQAGGVDGTSVLTRCSLYQLGGTWTVTGSLNVARSFHTATRLASGQVLVCGGNTQTSALTSCEIYDAPLATADVITGAGPSAANAPVVKTWDITPPTVASTWTAYGASDWGVNVAAVDMVGGGADEVATGPGPGTNYGPQVRGWDPSGTAISKVNYYAYGTLRFGVHPGGGNIDGDAHDEILTAPGPGAVFGPHIRGWNYDGVAIASMSKVSFFAYSTLRYGARTAGGDVDFDAVYDEIVTGAGAGAVFGPHVKGFNYDNAAVSNLFSFFAFGSGLYGASVATGNTDTGREEVIAGHGPDPGADSEVRGFSYSGAVTNVWSIVAFSGQLGGAEVSAGDVDSDGVDELVAGAGWGAANPSNARAYDIVGSGGTLIVDWAAYAGQTYGTKVAVGEMGII